jgi:hypothetical protein
VQKHDETSKDQELWVMPVQWIQAAAEYEIQAISQERDPQEQYWQYKQ